MATTLQLSNLPWWVWRESGKHIENAKYWDASLLIKRCYITDIHSFSNSCTLVWACTAKCNAVHQSIDCIAVIELLYCCSTYFIFTDEQFYTVCIVLLYSCYQLRYQLSSKIRTVPVCPIATWQCGVLYIRYILRYYCTVERMTLQFDVWPLMLM